MQASLLVVTLMGLGMAVYGALWSRNPSSFPFAKLYGRYVALVAVSYTLGGLALAVTALVLVLLD